MRKLRYDLRYYGVHWWFLLDGRVRVGIGHHERLQESWTAECMGVYRCADGEYRRIHVGPWCLRLRGRPRSTGNEPKALATSDNDRSRA